MSRDWDVTFSFWGAPPSNTEQEKCDNAERAIRKAIDANTALSNQSLKIFVQGSYANRTNVRQDSDVDICVLNSQTFYTDFSQSKGLNDAFLRFVDSAYTYASFKDGVEYALVSYFGRPSVRRGKKALDIRENTYRVNADVVPCFEHRLYIGDQNSHYHLDGTQLLPDSGGRIVNWPKQNYDNGIAKNDSTGRRFKAVTRILKNLRYELIDDGDKIAETIPSFLIECLVWNVPDEHLRLGTLKQAVRASILYLWNATRADSTCKDWAEVNGIKYLFHATQDWTRDNVNTFLQTAWNYVGLE
jgi:predicted nucleotidyltransferase